MKVYRVTFYGGVQHPFVPVEHVKDDAPLVRKVRDYDPDDPRYRAYKRDGNRLFAYDELKVGKRVPVFSVLVPITGIMDRHHASTEAEAMLIAWLKGGTLST